MKSEHVAPNLVHGDVISQLTLAEKASLMSGANFWNTKPVARLDIPGIMLTDGPQAEAVLADGFADAIFAGREWLRDPHFALTAAAELGVAVNDPAAAWPRQYERAAL